jgi:hypothetical protein
VISTMSAAWIATARPAGETSSRIKPDSTAAAPRSNARQATSLMPPSATTAAWMK